MKNYIAIAVKGKEFFYRRNTAIKCSSEKQSIMLCEHLNSNNDKACNGFKCNENEIWYLYEDIDALYRVKSTKGKVSIVAL